MTPTPEQIMEAVEVLKKYAYTPAHNQARCNEACEICAALSLLSGIEKLFPVEKAPEGVPEVIYTSVPPAIRAGVRACWENENMYPGEQHLRYRFDGIVETRNDAEDKAAGDARALEEEYAEACRLRAKESPNATPRRRSRHDDEDHD